MQDHQTIFSIKELRNKVNSAFPNGIPNRDQKIKIIKNWQQNISSGKYINAKEEEIKPLFLTQFFGEILGYDYDNATDWNLRFENKTAMDSTKSDGALGFFKIRNNEEVVKDVRAVIEIKDAKTTLDKPQNRKDFKGSAVEQCFMYAAKVGEKCKWVIVSNFLEIRLYLASDMTKYESFDVMSLTDEYEFLRFYYLLSNGQLFYESISSSIDIFLANRLEKEKTITKEFYAEFQSLRELFFYHLKKHNPTIDTLKLLQYAQTIMDRILFVSVIKDYDLINYNALNEIENIASKSWLQDGNELWRQTKGFFVALDNGLPPRVHKFNGGLFRNDRELDSLIIKDVFLRRLFNLNKYDFESDLNINVLGHIFEQSITDIETLKKDIAENKQIEYLETDDAINLKLLKSETNKRKKEGIFYTPENITRYIVKSTIGEWLEKQKHKLGIYNLDESPTTDKDKQHQIKLWENYQTVLSNIKVLDPACGSGAFLTQAYDYLLNEWLMTFDIINKLKGEKIEIKGNGLFRNAPTKTHQTISQIKKDIVNNNLFGVDLNLESVEITKLGLWLKSASKKDPLALLDNNIKCGNSLISDKTITEKAFVWETEFAEIMKAGGFDVIVGNPPYIFTRELLSEQEKKFFNTNFENTRFKLNTYILFIEKSFHLLHSEGHFGFIIPNTWLTIENSSDFRKFILTNTFDIKIINSYDKIFSDANVDVSILIFSKKGNDTIEISELANNNISLIKRTQKQDFLSTENSVINYNTNEQAFEIISKVNNQSLKLAEIANICDGVLVYEVGAGKPKQTEEMRDKRLFHSTVKHDNTWLKLADVQRYYTGWSGQYIKYGENLSRPRNSELFNQPRILVRHIPAQPPYSIFATYINEPIINDNSSMIITSNSDKYHIEYLLSIINSKLISFWFSKSLNKLNHKLFPKFIVGELSSFPIKPIEKQEQKIYVDLVIQILDLNKLLNDKIYKFKSNLTTNFDTIKITPTLLDFYKLDFKAFIEELSKQKISIQLKKQDEWLDYFNEHKQSTNRLVLENNEMNHKLDFLVYKLYNLTAEEIELIEKQ